MEKDFYTIAEVVELTGKSKSTVYRMINKGTLPAKNTKSGEKEKGSWIIPKWAYEKWKNTPDNI